MMVYTPVFVLFALMSHVYAQSVTIQYLAQETMIASGAHNSTPLVPPGLPNPMPNLAPFIQLSNNVPPGISIPLPSAFLGFSIEMSVANQVLGHNSSLIQVPFLNLAHNIVQRCGALKIRVGGNTQDHAAVDNGAHSSDLTHKILWKDYANRKSDNPTETPPVYLSQDFFYLLANISTFTNVHWYLGIPFNDTNWRLDIIDHTEAIIGDHFLGWQVANEPDFYKAHNLRDGNWSMADWLGELRLLVDTMSKEPKYANALTQFIIPSIANANGWTLQQLFDMGMVDQFNNNIKFLASERYPTDNCALVWHWPNPKDPQVEQANFLNHNTYIKNLVAEYIPSTAYAISKGKPFIMFETNTASCGGFPGISDSFGASLWSLDYAMQMAYGNFSGAMFHVGGQTTFYNPFTAPPTNETVFHQWTIGSMYYAASVMSEVMGTTNTSRILDLNANNGDAMTPAYIVYENDKPSKLGLFNYMDKAGGNAELTVSFAIGGSGVQEANGTPSSVKVKYLLSNSVADKGNFTWAGQTMGSAYGADGRLHGDEKVETINCNPDNTCQVKVPAPGFALVFLGSDPNPTAAYPSSTWATTRVTQTRNTAVVSQDVLATSNGHQNVAAKKYSTSYGSGNGNGAGARVTSSWVAVGSSVSHSRAFGSPLPILH
ncbi:glycoside hydrolase family 79 protein [Flagelloscypha sp. PMI_526]|nr:glycoside hydrolase family 79 protein [Flagelloscypha sp. PMI_526]